VEIRQEDAVPQKTGGQRLHVLLERASAAIEERQRLGHRGSGYCTDPAAGRPPAGHSRRTSARRLADPVWRTRASVYMDQWSVTGTIPHDLLQVHDLRRRSARHRLVHRQRRGAAAILEHRHGSSGPSRTP